MFNIQSERKMEHRANRNCCERRALGGDVSIVLSCSRKGNEYDECCCWK